uniref:Transport and Golgi organization protein 2 n=1 Tax=Parastrongyloides trichosuri TaxID=131310 RepID=A0A0N4ZUP7_PARTI
MCVTFFYFAKSGDIGKYKLIFINNRDEFLDRQTLSASWSDGVLCGRDLQDKAKGTWLGVSKNDENTFKLSNLLNITTKKVDIIKDAKSRGEITINYLKNNETLYDYCRKLEDEAFKYNGFHLITIEKKKDDDIKCCVLSNRLIDKVETLQYLPGIYGFGNSGIHKPYKKVERGLKIFSDFINNKMKTNENIEEDDIIEECLKILKDNTKCLPDHVMEELYEYPITNFSSIFQTHPPSIRYGTRTHTIITIDRNDKVTFFELTAENINSNLSDIKWIEHKYTFQL